MISARVFVLALRAAFGLKVHQPGALFLARVRKNRVCAGREFYEWFAGFSAGLPIWGPLSAKKPVFENPEGTGWCPSACHDLGLGRDLLATEHSVSHASVVSLFDAPEPWGPWTTVKYWTTDDRFGQTRPGSTLDWADNVFFFSFAPKWFSARGWPELHPRLHRRWQWQEQRFPAHRPRDLPDAKPAAATW